MVETGEADRVEAREDLDGFGEDVEADGTLQRETKLVTLLFELLFEEKETPLVSDLRNKREREGGRGEKETSEDMMEDEGCCSCEGNRKMKRANVQDDVLRREWTKMRRRTVKNKGGCEESSEEKKGEYGTNQVK